MAGTIDHCSTQTCAVLLFHIRYSMQSHCYSRGWVLLLWWTWTSYYRVSQTRGCVQQRSKTDREEGLFGFRRSRLVAGLRMPLFWFEQMFSVSMGWMLARPQTGCSCLHRQCSIHTTAKKKIHVQSICNQEGAMTCLVVFSSIFIFISLRPIGRFNYCKNDREWFGLIQLFSYEKKK